MTYLGLELFIASARWARSCCRWCWSYSWCRTCRTAAPAAASRRAGPLLALHITLNVLGYAAFALSFVLSLIYLIQNRLLRDRRLGSVVWRFPALEVLERMSRSSVLVGLVSLVVGMASAFYGCTASGDTTGMAIPRKSSHCVILAVYAGYLWLGRTTAWRGARASALCVFNFVFVLFSYSVVNLYLSVFTGTSDASRAG